MDKFINGSYVKEIKFKRCIENGMEIIRIEKKVRFRYNLKELFGN